MRQLRRQGGADHRVGARRARRRPPLGIFVTMAILRLVSIVLHLCCACVGWQLRSILLRMEQALDRIPVAISVAVSSELPKRPGYVPVGSSDEQSL